jgi:hypothetical protein
MLVRSQNEQLILCRNPMRPDSLKDAGPVVQGMRKDVHLRIPKRHVLPIEIDNQIRIRTRIHKPAPLRDSL